MTLREKVAHRVMEVRVEWGWTFQKRRPRVMALDHLIADAIIPIFIAEAAGVARDVADKASPHGMKAETARRIMLAIEQLGER